jgi:hypothetical protein
MQIKNLFSQLLLVFILFSTLELFSQNDKFIIPYQNAAYHKSLKMAEKALKKDSKNMEAYLYKSLSLVQVDLSMDAAFDKGIEKAMKSMKSLYRRIEKNGRKDFLQDNHTSIASIAKSAFLKANTYMEKKDYKRAIILYEDLIELFGLPEAAYRKGKCLMLMDEETEALEMLDYAAFLVLEKNKHSKETYYFPEPFFDLAYFLFDHNQAEKAFFYMNTALNLYGITDAKTDSLYKKGISLYTANIDIISTEETYLEYTKALDTLISTYPDDIFFIQQKWELKNTYFLYLLSQKDYTQASSFLLDWDKEKEEQAIYYCTESLKIIEYQFFLTFSLKYISQQERADALWKIWTEVYSACNTARKADNIHITIMKEIYNAKDIEKTLTLHTFLKEQYPSDKALTDIENAVVDDILQNPAYSETDLRRWYYLLAFEEMIPKNTKLAKHQKESIMELVPQYLQQNQFSEAAIMLKYLRKKYPEESFYHKLDRQRVLKDYAMVYKRSWVDDDMLKWTGNIEHCDPGRISEIAKEKTLERMNYFRRTAGVPDCCVFRDDYEDFCQAAAFLMMKNNTLSHAPENTWSCFSEDAYKGASHSNLSLGNHSTDAISSQMRDQGSSNMAAGHRRWILHPSRTQFAHGSVPHAMALWVLGIPGESGTDSLLTLWQVQEVAWPPEGYIPKALVFQRWSFGMAGMNFSEARVNMLCNGEEIPVKQEKYQSGYAIPTLVWIPEKLKESDKDITYSVHIKNVKNYAGEYHSFHYLVTVINP